MNEQIREVILTTIRADGTAHMAPMGVRQRGEELLLAPFRPSGTLDNLLRERAAVVNLTDDVRLYAGCLCDRRDWPLIPASLIGVPRLRDALAHQELRVTRIEDDDVRPRLFCRVVHEANHRPFRGYNRAQAAVLEFAILISRLDRLPRSKLEHDIEYLRIAMEKTAGEREWEAWSWLEQKMAEHQSRPLPHDIRATPVGASAIVTSIRQPGPAAEGEIDNLRPRRELGGKTR